MNYWYAPVDDSQYLKTPRLPPELVAAVAAPWRSTKELEAIRAKARILGHYDMAGEAQDILVSRKQQETDAAVKGLRHGQLLSQLQADTAALEALTAIDNMWSVHLKQLRHEACAAVRALQEKHEDALARLRLDQVARAHDMGIRPERRSKELLNLRRSESVLVSKSNFKAAVKVKAHADELAASEACSAHMAWLLKCHGEQERLLAKQRRELEALRTRLDARLREVEAARDRDMQKLERKIKVASSQQQRSFACERRFLEQALHGATLDVRTTRVRRTMADALPTMADMSAAKQQQEDQQQPPGSQADGRSSTRPRSARVSQSTPGAGYLGPSSTSREGAGIRVRSDGPFATLGVRFAPTPPKQAWGQALASKADGDASAGGNSSIGANGGRSGSTQSSSSKSSGAMGSGSWSTESVDGDQIPSERPPSRHLVDDQAKAAALKQAPPSSAAVGSGTTAAATGSGSSALTEEALRAMNQAAGVQTQVAQRGASSMQSSSFKSNKPYAGGISVRAVALPTSQVATAR